MRGSSDIHSLQVVCTHATDTFATHMLHSSHARSLLYGLHMYVCVPVCVCVCVCVCVLTSLVWKRVQATQHKLYKHNCQEREQTCIQHTTKYWH